MKQTIIICTMLLIVSCNRNGAEGFARNVATQVSEPKSLNINGFTSVKTFEKDGATFVMFEPFIPRDDTAMSYTFLELGEQIFDLKKKPWPKQDIVDVSGGKAIRYKYKSKELIFMPMKNDDGTIHTVMITQN